MKLKNICINSIAAFLIAFATPVFCATINVPEDYSTIQEAIDGAVNGDIIVVSEGKYYENLVIANKHITIGSLYLTTGDEYYIATTYINGNHNGRVIQLIGDEGSPTTISGLTITNGYVWGEDIWGEGTPSLGAGIYCQDSNVVIDHCNVTLNELYTGIFADTDPQGAGIFTSNSNLTISNSSINSNEIRSSCNTDPKGAGIAITYNSIATISNSIISITPMPCGHNKK